MEVVAFHSARIDITVKADGHRHKIFQIFFRKDGSVFVSFPYFSKTEGILAEVTVRGAPGSSCEVNLADTGKVASHLMKYSHHPDGRAHFSQDGKVKTEIKRQSVPLRDQEGHLFTLLFQGLRAFTPVNAKNENQSSLKRTTLTFDVPDRFPKAFRIVGRWFWLEDLQVEPVRPAKIGPIVQLMDVDTLRNAREVRLRSTDYKGFKWCARRDSNPRPTGSKPVALSS